MAIELLTPVDCTNKTLVERVNELIGVINTTLPPTINSITPEEGPEAGGTEIVIIGIGFTGATAVNFAATPGTSFSVVSDEEINVTTPAGAAGAVDVVVAHPNGNATVTGGFTYI